MKEPNQTVLEYRQKQAFMKKEVIDTENLKKKIFLLNKQEYFKTYVIISSSYLNYFLERKFIERDTAIVKAKISITVMDSINEPSLYSKMGFSELYYQKGIA